MTRISSAMINANALTHLQIAQEDMFEAQRQSATQTKADDLKGFGRDAKSLVTLQRMLAKGQSHVETSQELNLRLSLQDVQLERAASVMGELKQSLTEAIALDNLSEVDALVNNAFNDLKSVFNSTHNGKYMFAGTLSDTAPIQAASLADLSANPLTDAISQDGAVQKIRIDDSRVVDAGPLAKDSASEVFSVLRDLKIFSDSASGPFSSNPDDAQKAAIDTAISGLGAAFDNILSVQAQNGSVMNETDTVIERQQSENNLLEKLSADITDVDLAEVAVRLNQAQLQFQASASIFNRIQSLSLVDYLR
jgi:flagellar hook-associated protein 3 FlgL